MDAYVVKAQFVSKQKGYADCYIWSGVENDDHHHAMFLWPTTAAIPEEMSDKLDLYGPLTLEEMQQEAISHGGWVAEVGQCGEDAGPCLGCRWCAEQLTVGWPYTL
jgi:hypothetical protein